jgi:hypothetical protein
MPYNEELARCGDWKSIDASEKVKCDVALAAEKKAAVIARAQQREIVKAPIATAIDKATVPPVDLKPPAPVDEPDEPLKMDLDDLDALDLAGLKAVIDTEELDVKKTFKADTMRQMIREARKAKPVVEETPKAEG